MCGRRVDGERVVVCVVVRRVLLPSQGRAMAAMAASGSLDRSNAAAKVAVVAQRPRRSQSRSLTWRHRIANGFVLSRPSAHTCHVAESSVRRELRWLKSSHWLRQHGGD
jgi:hypothetical protein